MSVFGISKLSLTLIKGKIFATTTMYLRLLPLKLWKEQKGKPNRKKAYFLSSWVTFCVWKFITVILTWKEFFLLISSTIMSEALDVRYKFLNTEKSNLPSRLIPAAIHFFKRQYWHRLRLILRILHCWFFVQGRYWIFCWIDLRKKPWKYKVKQWIKGCVSYKMEHRKAARLGSSVFR